MRTESYRAVNRQHRGPIVNVIEIVKIEYFTIATVHSKISLLLAITMPITGCHSKYNAELCPAHAHPHPITHGR